MNIITSIVIQTYTPISDSGNQTQRIFGRPVVDVTAHLAQPKVQFWISGQGGVLSPYILDDGITVNGKLFAGFSGTTDDPKRHIGENPSVCYRPVPAQDVTDCLRKDGHFYFELEDLGGYTFTNSDLFLIVATP